MEDIKNASVETGKYSGYKKTLRSTTLVVFANFLPNLSIFSLDRWKFFHTKLGEVFVSCKTGISEFTYACFLDRIENKCDSALDPSAKKEIEKTDKQLIAEYLEVHKVDISFQVLCDNSLSFPAVTIEHKHNLRRYIKNLQFHSFSSYVSEHNLLANSIVEPDFIKKSPLMLCGIPDSNIDYDSRGSQMGTDEGSE